MSFFENFLMYELCFPGAITGETEVDCPYCQQLLTVVVADPLGEEVYQCCECTGTFEVDWGEGVVRYQTEEWVVEGPGALLSIRFPHLQRR